MIKISLIQPSRNNLKYLKWSYESIRKNQGDHEVQICIADDASTDGTREWLEQRSVVDPFLAYIVNDSGDRVGHTILYDRLVNEVAIHDVCMIFHADMYLCPNALDAIQKHMYTEIPKDHDGVGYDTHEIPKCIVSLTRIEPPLHPDGPEKILADYGTEPESFKEDEFLEWFSNTGFDAHYNNGDTEGIFAPWAFWKSDFQEIGGHDPLFAPQSKEDSDIFNRFQLNGVKFIQTWEGFVYHMTCRGSRRNTHDGAVNIQTDNPEWLEQNERSSRNFIRKWGHFVKHDSYMKPIIPPKYDIGFVVNNCNSHLLGILEPWCSKIYIEDGMGVLASHYIDAEQKNTSFDLSDRIELISYSDPKNDILVFIDAHEFTNSDFKYIQDLPEILADSGEEGAFELGNMKLVIRDMKTFEMDLIKIKG